MKTEKRFTKCIALVLVLTFLLALSACGGSTAQSGTSATQAPTAEPAKEEAPSAAELKDLTILTGPSGGTMEIVGAAAIEIFKKYMPSTQFSSVPSTGSAVNIKMLEAGEGDMAIVTADTFAAALAGQEPFEKPVEGLAALCALYPNTIQLWSLPESNIHDFSDLESKTFTCGQYGGGPYQPCMNMMKVFGMTEESINAAGGKITPLAWGEATSSLQDGNIDAVFWTTSYPAAGIVNASVGRDFELVQINRDKLAEYKNTFDGWVDITIPAGTYSFQSEDIYTVGTPNLFVVRADLSEDVIYTLTKAICENYDSLAAAHALLKNLNNDTVAQGLTDAVHPGALKYYQEAGIKVN